MLAEDTSQGHRRRLREKFHKGGLAGFQDYEIVELLLTLGSPRKDCKQPAKAAIDRFKSLRGVLEAPKNELEEIPGIGPNNAIAIRLIQEVARKYLKDRIIEKPVYRSPEAIFEYLYHSMRDLKKEVFKVIYLNSRNQIIETDDLFKGTVNASAVAPREIIEGAIKHNAVSLIFAHNHPSGDPSPSKSDRDVTRDLVHAAIIMQIKVLDHIVIGDNTYFSFASDGLIEAYESEFRAVQDIS